MIIRSIDEVLSRPNELYATCVSPPLRWLSGLHRTCSPQPLSLSSSALAPRDITPKFLKPLTIAGGTITLSRCIIIAPTSRSRKLFLLDSVSESPDRIWTPDIQLAAYYAELTTPRGLVITESINVVPSSDSGAGCFWHPEQIEAWKSIVSAVHADGGYIYAQLASDERSLTEDNAETKLQQYVDAAKLALEAGFDGVEINAAQFLRSSSHLRTELSLCRSRFILELFKAAGVAIGIEKIGIRLSRYGDVQTYKSLCRSLREQSRGRLSYVRFVDAREGGKDNERGQFGREMDLRWTRECLGLHVKVFCDGNGGSAKDAVERGEIHGLVFEELPAGWKRNKIGGD